MSAASRLVGVVVAAVCAAALLGACGDSTDTDTAGSAATESGATVAPQEDTLPPATFASLPSGWHAFDGTETTLTDTGAVAESYATSWAFDPSSGNGPAGDLPEDGAIVDVLLLRRSGGGEAAPELCREVPVSADYPPIEGLPLELEAMRRGTLEGTRDVPQYRFMGTQGGGDYRVEVRVSLAPGSSRAEAQQVLEGLELPSWGDRC